MFGIDFSEILVIFVIALVVLGPEKLPKLAQNIGRWVGRARTMARQFREQLEQEAETLRREADPHIHDPTHNPVTAEQLMPDPPPPPAAQSAAAPRECAAPASAAAPDIPSHTAGGTGAAASVKSHERGS
jgi:sec-independent protein translocase protein TatB